MHSTAPIQAQIEQLDDATLATLLGRSMLLTEEWTLDELQVLSQVARVFEGLDRAGIRTPLFPEELFYALFFAMAAGTIKTTLWVLGTFMGFIVFGLMANDLLANYFGFFARVNIVEVVIGWMLDAPGPFQVITGSWSLIDV